MSLMADLLLGYPGLQTFWEGTLDRKQETETTKGKMEKQNEKKSSAKRLTRMFHVLECI